MRHPRRDHPAAPPHPDRLAAGHDDVFDLRQFARHFVLLGVRDQRVVVRRKWGTQRGTFRFQHVPLRFFDFVPLPDTGRRFKHR